MTKAICSQHLNFPLELWYKFSFRTNIFCWSVMDSLCHFDPFVQQNENTIYHYLHHSDFVGGARFHCKNICGLVTQMSGFEICAAASMTARCKGFRQGNKKSVWLFPPSEGNKELHKNTCNKKSIMTGKQTKYKWGETTTAFFLRQILAAWALSSCIDNWGPNFRGMFCYCRCRRPCAAHTGLPLTAGQTDTHLHPCP